MEEINTCALDLRLVFWFATLLSQNIGFAGQSRTSAFIAAHAGAAALKPARYEIFTKMKISLKINFSGAAEGGKEMNQWPGKL